MGRLNGFLRRMHYSLRQCTWLHPMGSTPSFVMRGRGARFLARSSSSTTSSEEAATQRHMRNVLQKFQEGHVNIESAVSELSKLQNSSKPTENALLSSFCNLDHHRAERTSFPEVVFAQGKTPQQVALILEAMAAKKQNAATRAPILATRYVDDLSRKSLLDECSSLHSNVSVTPEMYQTIESEATFHHGRISYHPLARIISMEPNGAQQDASERRPNEEEEVQHEKRRVVVATAGTTDIAVAEEAAVLLEASAVPVDRIYDVGVAGLHRVLAARPQLTDPRVASIIVCAGMDGALPSVIGGLVRVPVIAVPTSVGYGASFSGVSALLTMLNSCAPGVCVMNIDNGFGAAAFAYKCLQLCK